MKLMNIVSAAALVATFGTAASAHASLETQEATAGTYYKAVVRISHGCNGEATLKVRVQIPEGVISIKPMPKAGWNLETVAGAYANSYELHGRAITEGVTEIVWDGELADPHFDEFTFMARLDGSLPAGEMLYFPTVQECENGKNAWVEIPEVGQNSHDLKHPAPGLMLNSADAHSH